MSNTLQSLASEARGYFTTIHRESDDKTIWVRKGITPDWIADMVYFVHGGQFLPSDVIYSVVVEVLDLLSDCLDDDSDRHDAMDVLTEIEPDIYIHDLFDWVKDNGYHMRYVDDAMSEQYFTSLSDALQYAQYEQKREIGSLVLDYLVDHLEGLENEEMDE